MTSPTIGSGIGKPHSFEDSRIISSRVKALHMDGNIFHLPVLGSMPNPLCQDGPDPFLGSNAMEKLSDLIYLSPGNFFFNPSHLRGFDSKCAKASCRNGIHAQTVTDIIEIGNLFDLVNHAETPKCIDRLIFRPFAF